MTFAERARLYAAPALEKGLDLLETLASEDAPQSQADLARLLRRSPNEIFRMLNCLERRGYISKEAASGRYRLTLRLYELAHTHTPVDHLLRAAERPMRDLSRDVSESCHLSVLSEGKLLVLAQVESQKRTRLSVEVGSRFPLARTASGRVLLAALQQEDLDELLSRDEEFRRMGSAERRVFLTRLLDVRRSGVYAGKSDLTQGVRDVAALVGNPRVKVAAALCVPFLTVVGRPRPVAEIRAAVVRTAETITRQLGLTGKR